MSNRTIDLPKLEWLSYCLLLLLLFGPSLYDPNMLIGSDVDFRGTIWYYWWIKHALFSGIDPTFTPLQFAPIGMDILARTGFNFIDAYLSIPFQLVFGFPRYFSIFMLALFAGNGLAFRWLLTTINVSPKARWIATLLWMINPFVLHEFLWGRPTQALLFFSILAIRSFWLLHKEPQLRHAVFLGLWTGLQGLTYWYGGYFLTFVLLWLSICLFRKGASQSSTAKLLQYYAASILTCFAIISYLVYQIMGKAALGLVPGLGVQSNHWLDMGEINNVCNGCMLGYQLNEGIGSSMNSFISADLRYPMFHSYLWGPLLIAVCVFGRQRLLWFGALVVTLLLAIGPTWNIAGTDFAMPQYMLLYHYLPFFDRLWFPYRILGLSFIVLIVGAAILMDTHQQKKWVIPLVLVGFCFGVGESIYLRSIPLLTSTLGIPSFTEYIKKETGGVIDVPLRSGKNFSVLLQMSHQQPIIAGMGANSNLFLSQEQVERMENNSFLVFLNDVLLSDEPEFSFAEEDKLALMEEGFRFVILNRRGVKFEQINILQEGNDNWGRSQFNPDSLKSAFQVQRDITSILGYPLMIDDAYVLWDLQVVKKETCCPDQYEQIWEDAVNPHAEVLDKMNSNVVSYGLAPESIENEVLLFPNVPNTKGGGSDFQPPGDPSDKKMKPPQGQPPPPMNPPHSNKQMEVPRERRPAPQPPSPSNKPRDGNPKQ